VGDLFMSLIHMCELNGANPFEYLIELQKRAEEVEKSPATRMPWNYRVSLSAPRPQATESGGLNARQQGESQQA